MYSSTSEPHAQPLPEDHHLNIIARIVVCWHHRRPANISAADLAELIEELEAEFDAAAASLEQSYQATVERLAAQIAELRAFSGLPSPVSFREAA